jgi:hypothetical protein
MKLSTLAGAVIVLATAGCSSSGSVTGSCTVSPGGGTTYCIEYIGSFYNSGNIQSQCTMSGGTFSSSACAAGNAGSCSIGVGGANEVKWIFSSDAGCNVADGGFNEAQALCSVLDAGFSCP